MTATEQQTTTIETTSMTVALPPRPLKTSEVAQAFGVDPKTIIRWVGLGKLHPITTPGGHYRFPVDEVLACLDRGFDD